MPKPTLYRTWQSYNAACDPCDDPTIIRYTAPVDEEQLKSAAVSRATAQWCCTSEFCAVDKVQIAWQVQQHVVPAMRCPACGDPMTFLHYLEERALEPVDWTGVGRKTA